VYNVDVDQVGYQQVVLSVRQIRYTGSFDAEVMYDGFKELVFKDTRTETGKCEKRKKQKAFVNPASWLRY
jgi:hypothetical protein